MHVGKKDVENSCGIQVVSRTRGQRASESADRTEATCIRYKCLPQRSSWLWARSSSRAEKGITRMQEIYLLQARGCA